MARPRQIVSSGTGPVLYMSALRQGVVVALAVFGLVSAVGGLLTAGAVGRVTLLLLALACAVYTVGLVIWTRFGGGRSVLTSEVESLRNELAVQRRQWRLERRHLLTTMMQVVDHQAELYEEDLLLIVGIGARDLEDWIQEERTTTPRGLAYFRSFRLITPGGDDHGGWDDEQHLVEVSVQGGVSTARFSVVEHGAGGVRVLVVFDPPLSSQTTWIVRYQVPGLWRPLRTGSTDSLFYDTRSPMGSELRAQFRSFRVRFVLDDWKPPAELAVSERAGLGRIVETDASSVLWVAEDGNPRVHEWDLTVVRGATLALRREPKAPP